MAKRRAPRRDLPLHVVFAGAGASRALGDEYPTTAELTARLPPEVVSSGFFQHVLTFLSKKGSTQPDVEQILWTLEEFERWIAAAGEVKDFVGWMLQGSRLKKQDNDQPLQIHDLLRATPSLRSEVRILRSRIEQTVFSVFGRSPAEVRLDETWIPLLQPLTPLGAIRDFRLGERRLEVFTTNYDGVLEEALLRLQGLTGFPASSIGSGELHKLVGLTDAVVGRTKRELDLSQWQGSEPTQRPGLITKLHGSLNWVFDDADPKRVLVDSSTRYKGPDAHVLLYPGFKEVPERFPFSLFHEHLERCVERSTTITVIGFAFRDAYINSILKRAPARTRVFVVDPGELTAAGMPFRHADQVEHFEEGFSKSSASRVVSSILDAEAALLAQ